MERYLIFSTYATRDAALLAPPFGTQVFIQATGETLVWLGKVYGWRPPWNTPWGQVGYAAIPKLSSLNAVNYAFVGNGSGLDLGQGLSAAFTALPRRLYRVEYQALISSNADGDDLIIVAVWLPSTRNLRNGESGPWTQQFTRIPTGYTGTAAYPLNQRRLLATGTPPVSQFDTNIQNEPGEMFMVLSNLSGSGGKMSSDSSGDTYIAVFDEGPSDVPLVFS
jgi:hypothetical protein